MMTALAAYSAAGILAIRIGLINELLTLLVGFSFYVVWLAGGVAVVSSLLSGALQRAFASPLVKVWFALVCWMSLSALFSTWKSDSIRILFAYVLFTFVLLPVLAGVPPGMRTVRRMLTAVAWGGVLTVLSARMFAGEGDRAIGFGSIGNANDLAAHFLAVLPVVAWAAIRSRWKLMKLLYAAAIVTGLAVGAASGSRGALIGLGIATLVALFSIPLRYKIVFVFLMTAVGFIVVATLSDSLIQRYATLWSDDSHRAKSEAEASRDTREYLLRRSIDMTLDNPIFGVGVNQFPNIEGSEAKKAGRPGVWQNTHNGYTQISSETGIPGLVIFLTAQVMAWRLLGRVRRLSRGHAFLVDAYTAATCLRVAMAGFFVALLFLSLGYTIYTVVFSGLAIALNNAVLQELADRQPARPRPA